MSKTKLTKQERKYYKDLKELKATIKRFITEQYGERCEERMQGCTLCLTWSIFDTLDLYFF